MTNQIAFSFDKETLQKIGRGALYAMSVPAALGLLEFIGSLEISNPVFASFVAWGVPVAITAVKEWAKGR